jgi:hypothetical protein
MARRRSSEVDNADFAAAVIELYKAAMRGELEKFAGTQDREVREVAFGITIIRQLLDREAKAEKAPPDPAKPVLGALAIVDALTSGRDHPIWRHIAGLKSKRFRMQNAPPNRAEHLGRVCVVGLVRAYQQTANVSAKVARDAVIAACRFEDFAFGTEQIKRWDRTFREQNEQGPDAFANLFFDEVKKLEEAIEAGDERAKGFEWFTKLGPDDRVLAIGRKRVWQTWAIPGAQNDP